MAIRNIFKDDAPCLYKVARPVEKFDAKLFKLLDDMAETMYAAEGVGLAAPQVGILRRVFVMDCGDGLIEAINPEILETSGEQEGAEGCLSVPGEYGIVKRPMDVRVRAQDRNGNWFEAEGTGLTARCFCHEIDHLNGIVFLSKAERMLTDEEMEDLEHEEESGE